MDSTILKELLIEYDKKKMNAEKESSTRKIELYKKYPILQEMDDSLNKLAFSTTKALINENDPNVLKSFQKQIDDLHCKKSAIFKQINIPEDYLQPKYECEQCKDTGYIINPDYTSSMCSCLKQKIFDMEYNKSNISNLKTQNFGNFSDLLYSDEVNSDKYHANISPRENIHRIRKLCDNFIQDFDNPNGKNLIFTGNTGLGKTFLSSCIANELLKKHKNVLYQTAPVMLDTIIDYRFGKSNINKNMYDNLLNVDLLIIDDLGTETINKMKFTELFNIINTRLLNQNHVMKTIISTNLSLNNLYDTYDERIVSRIVGNYSICYFFGDDIRFKIRN